MLRIKVTEGLSKNNHLKRPGFSIVSISWICLVVALVYRVNKVPVYKALAYKHVYVYKVIVT